MSLEVEDCHRERPPLPSSRHVFGAAFAPQRPEVDLHAGEKLQKYKRAILWQDPAEAAPPDDHTGDNFADDDRNREPSTH